MKQIAYLELPIKTQDDKTMYQIGIDFQGLIGFDNTKVPFIGNLNTVCMYDKKSAEKVIEFINNFFASHFNDSVRIEK